MSEMIYAALCNRPDGSVVRAWANASTLTFAGIATVPIPTQPLWVSIAATEAEVIAVGQGHEGPFGGQAIVIRQDGTVTALGPAHGILCTGIRRDGSRLIAVWVNPGALTYSEQDVATGARRELPLPPMVHGTSQGFIGFDPDGMPRWTDTHRNVKVRDVLLTLPAPEVNGAWCGQSNRFYGVEAVTADGRAWKVKDDTPIQVPPQLIAHPDGSLEACYAFQTDDPTSLFVPQAQWADMAASAPPPPVPPPTPQPTPDCRAAEARAEQAEEKASNAMDMLTRQAQTIIDMQAEKTRLTDEVKAKQAALETAEQQAKKDKADAERYRKVTKAIAGLSPYLRKILNNRLKAS